jgi:hypothetical protein
MLSVGKKMRLRLFFAGLTLFLLGCGNGPGVSVVGFLNATRHSDAELWQIWRQAQLSIATQIDLNPLQSAPHDILPGDARALSVPPHHLQVRPEQDISAQALFAETGILRASPTGLIACPQSCDARFAAAFSEYQPPSLTYAASWELSENNFGQLLQYEFENQILYALGYSVTWR